MHCWDIKGERTEKVLALSSAEFVCSDICITLNCVHALENICNKIKLYCIDLICFSAYGVRKQTIDWLFEKVDKSFRMSKA